MRIQAVLILSLSWLPMLASAEQIRPGLWEFTGNMQSDGQAMPDMQQMLDQLHSMPPEQRQMMEQMMTKQSVKLGGSGVQLCLSEEQAKARDVPLADPNSGCTHEITERGEDVMKFRFTCPDGQGEGETHFDSDTAFSTQLKGVYSGRQSNMHSQARWLGADCGGLLPR